MLCLWWNKKAFVVVEGFETSPVWPKIHVHFCSRIFEVVSADDDGVGVHNAMHRSICVNKKFLPPLWRLCVHSCFTCIYLYVISYASPHTVLHTTHENKSPPPIHHGGFETGSIIHMFCFCKPHIHPPPGIWGGGRKNNILSNILILKLKKYKWQNVHILLHWYIAYFKKFSWGIEIIQ